MPSYSFREGLNLTSDEFLAQTAARYPHKFHWFIEHGYEPHQWQSLFHSLENPIEARLARYRMLVAGRRGGKTMSAAWEVLYYALFPEHFHWDTRREQSSKPLWIQVLAKSMKVGRPSLLMFREVLTQAGLVHGKDYKENRSENYFEFPNGSLIEWKTAVDPESLRGAGLDILWIDEAAFITSADAYNVIHPALMQKLGTVLGTTTPDGKNWFYEEFWSKEAMADPEIGRVEYRSIDNPYFPKQAWEYEKRRMHPMLFAREYEASFDSMMGKELPGDWLTKHFYTLDDLPRTDKDKLDLRIYIGIDPAISLADTADRFSLAVIGVERDNSTVYLLKVYAGRIPFAEQLDIIREYHLKWKPELIGIESQAYQAALAQMTIRMDTMPPVVPMLARGKKSERILSMSPLFRIGKVRVRAHENDFIEEWLNYDTDLKNPKDDTLDAVEIALRTAGALMPEAPDVKHMDFDRPLTMEELVRADLPKSFNKKKFYDEHLGAEV